MELTVFFLLLTWLLRNLFISGKLKDKIQNNSRLQTFNSSLSFVRTPLNAPLLFFLFLVIFQMIPLPPSVLKLLSPNTYSLYQQTLSGWPYDHDAGYRIQDADFNSMNSTNSINLSRLPRSKDVRDKMPAGLSNQDSIDFKLTTRNLQPATNSRPLSIYPHATKIEFFKFISCLGVFFLVINTGRSRARIIRLVRVIILMGAIIAFLGIIQMASGTDKIYWFWQSHYKIGGYFGPYVNPNHFACYLEMVIPLTIGFFLCRQSPATPHKATSWRYRLLILDSWFSTNALLTFLIVLMIAALFFSLSRGGILTFLFSLVFMFNFLLHTRHRRKRNINLLISILSIATLFLFWMGIDPILKELSTLVNLPKASPHRPIVWKDTLNLARDFPVFGVGLGNFRNLYPKYKTIRFNSFWDHTHNDYLEMLSDTGGLGVLFFFGGLIFFLVKIIKKWQQRRDPFVRGITLGGITGAVAILLHSIVEFNLHIPANALLLFFILGLTGTAVHLRVKDKKEFSSLPTRTLTLKPRMKLALYPLTVILFFSLSITVIKTYLAFHNFQHYQNSMNPTNLLSAVALDPSNASYRYEMGQYYARKMRESSKEGTWKLVKGKLVFEPGEKTLDYGLKALDSYFRAIELQPTNGWYHLDLGWFLSQLSVLSPQSSGGNQEQRTKNREPNLNSMSSITPGNELSLAVRLDPNNSYIKDYVSKWQSKNQ